MKSVGIVVALACLLLLVGCNEAERLENELAAANARIHALDSTLSGVQAASLMESAQVYNLMQDVQTLQEERDDLQGFVSDSKMQVSRLNTSLREARVANQKSLDSLQGINAALAIDMNTTQTELENAQVHIVAAERRTNDLIRARDSLYAFVDGVRPWYDYYKHESERNWLKKLFMAGDVERPEGLEPVFDGGHESMELEAMRP